VLLASVVGVVAGLGLWASTGASSAATVPSPGHVVVVVLENHGYSQVIGSSSAPYINSLATGGAKLTQFFAETHPSQPNYYAMFSGGTQGITGDACVKIGFSSAANLGSELIAAGKTWGSYNEGLPSQGSTVCTSSAGKYAQKHNPWFGFSNVPTSTARTFTQFPTDYTTLPKISFVIPNLCDDMHDCSVATGDTWVKNKLGAYATWAKSNNSLLVVTFDEDNNLSGNRVATVVYGQPVAAGSSSATTYNHYSLLRTLEDMAGLSAHAGNAASASDITGIWS
jgi:acid phosphatase